MTAPLAQLETRHIQIHIASHAEKKVCICKGCFSTVETKATELTMSPTKTSGGGVDCLPLRASWIPETDLFRRRTSPLLKQIFCKEKSKSEM